VTVARNDTGAIQYIHSILGRSGGCPRATLQVIAKQTARAITSGTPVEKCIASMLDVDCGRPGFEGVVVTKSCVDGLAQALKRDEEIEKEMRTNGSD
jgi:hypothetical protein